MNTAAMRAEINRENAQHSTGPKTEEGKQRSSNALRHGLTSQLVVLPGEDLEQYRQHLASFQHDLRPFGADEHNLVQILADTSWRLHRVAVLEANLLTHGAFTETTEAPNPDRTIKGFATLSLHGQRLNKQFETTLRLLKNIQRERKKENEGLAQTINYIKSFENDGYIWDAAETGFVLKRSESEPEEDRLQNETAAHFHGSIRTCDAAVAGMDPMPVIGESVFGSILTHRPSDTPIAPA